MKGMKKLCTMALAGALIAGTVATSSAAELDLAWYAEKNPDVVAAFGNSLEMLQLHYETYGRKEARMANAHDAEAQLRRLFNSKEYAALYPDVKAAFGENTEAMFQHYMAFGLLESRRPSEKVSQATASNLKKTVEKALAGAGLVATPGSTQLVAVITGEIKTSVADAAVQQVLTQVTSVVEKAVTETVQAVNYPAASSSGKSASSDNSNKTSGSQVTLKNQDLSGKTSAEGEVVKITSANFKDYFDLTNPSAPTVKEGVTLYEKYPMQITADKLNEYVTVSASASVALKDNTAAYYELDEGTELSNDNVGDYFTVDKAGKITIKNNVNADTGIALGNASGYVTGTPATMNVTDTTLYYKDSDDSDAAKPVTKDNVTTYFKVGDDGKAAKVDNEEAHKVYSDQEMKNEVTENFDSYITVNNDAKMTAEENKKVYQFKLVEGDTLITYFDVDNQNVKRSTAGENKKIATKSGDTYAVENTDGNIAEVIDANKAKVTDKPMYKYDADADATTLLKNSDLTEEVVTVDGTTVTIAQDVVLYNGAINKLVNATVNSKIGDYLNIPAQN